MTGEIDRYYYFDGWKLVSALALIVAVIITCLALGGEWWNLASGAWEVLPISLLAVFSYLGNERQWAKALTIVILAVIILSAGLAIFLFSLTALVPELISRST